MGRNAPAFIRDALATVASSYIYMYSVSRLLLIKLHVPALVHNPLEIKSYCIQI